MMPIILDNQIIRLNIQRPGEIYQGSRFDWSGQIAQITYQDTHTFCTTEIADSDCLSGTGRGLYNEFGIDDALGYETCPVGGQFHKIGVGLLTKTNTDDYQFYYPYAIEPADFEFQHNGLSAVFTAWTSNVRGYAYSLVKQIELIENSFYIHYLLTNTGDLLIHTNEYVHNFLAIDNHLLDNNYHLKFPFHIDTSLFGETVNPDETVIFEPDSMGWKSVHDSPFFFSQINPTHQPSCWQLEHEIERVGIREIADFEVQRINVWGTRHVVSPEIFYLIDLLPGQFCKWSRRYEIYSY